MAAPDGTDYELEITSGQYLPLISSENDSPSDEPFTISFWYRSEDLYTSSVTLLKWDSETEGEGYILEYGSNNITLSKTTTPATDLAVLPVTIDDNTWHMIVVTVTTNGITIKVMGGSDVSETATILERGAGLVIGNAEATEPAWEIYDYRLYRREVNSQIFTEIFDDINDNNGANTLPYVG